MIRIQRTYIIAEAGVNHNGSLELARRLIDAAAAAGCDAIKFQTFKAERLVSRHAAKAEYQLQTTDAAESHYEMIKKLELNKEMHLDLLQHSKTCGIEFLSSPFDHESIDLLASLGLEIFKIPSGEITNLPYLRKIGGLNKKLIISTGMSTLGEIESALGILTSAGTAKENITVLHCNTEYPTPFQDVNLRAMLTIRDAFGIRVGYSDHTPGIDIALAAVALGAEVIEKHITLDKNMEGPDHKASIEPQEFKLMVASIRNIEKALGNGIKMPSSSEIKNIAIARKSIVAIKPIRSGDVFTKDNIGIKRPGSGISPLRFYEVVGRRAIRDFDVDDLIVI